MSSATRIRSARVAVGKSEAEMSRLLGLTIASYGDLEQHDNELAFCLSLSQALNLASILGVGLHSLLAEVEYRGKTISLTQLPELIRAHVAREGITLAQFEEIVGWELSSLLDSPTQTALENPIIFLQDVASGLGVEWLSVVPHEDAV